jgi:F0F1-type ATP synthase membrane subunit b/b'
MILSLAISNVLFALAEGGETRWWDYPGFELWKFVNLGIFVALLAYILTRKVKLGEAFRTRRENIRAELARAQQQRDAAVAKLKEVEARLALLDSEVGAVREQSRREAAEEKERIARATETEIARLGEQAQREIERAGKTARHELRRYTAEQSVRLAEEMIRREMKPQDDARLITRNIEELGGAAR